MAIEALPSARLVETGTAYADILSSYCDFDREWKALSDTERKEAEPKSLLYYAVHGHFYAGAYNKAEFLPLIRLANHLALIDPAYVAVLQRDLHLMLTTGSKTFDAKKFEQRLNNLHARIAEDAQIQRRVRVAGYFRDLQDTSKRGYDVSLEDPLKFYIGQARVLLPENDFEPWLSELTEGNKNLKLAYDIRKIREEVMAMQQKTDAELVKLQKDLNTVRAALGLAEVKPDANLSLANKVATLVGVGEGMVAAKGVADLGVGVPLPVSFAIVGLSGFFSNFYLTRDDTQETLDALSGQGRFVSKPGDGLWTRIKNAVNDRKLFFDSKNNPVDGWKKGYAFVSLFLTMVVGGLFGYLSFISGWQMLTGLVLGSSVSAGALLASPVLIPLALATAASVAVGLRLEGWKRVAALAAIAAATAGIGIFALPLMPGVIAGVVSLIAVSSAITIASILLVAMVQLVKNDGLGNLKKYLRDAFVNPAWSELSRGEKLKHVFGHCTRSLVGLAATLAINTLSLAGQFIMFSAFTIQTFGNAILGYALAGANGLVHVPFGFIKIQQQFDALMKFGRQTYARLTQPKENLSELQQTGKRPGVISTVVGYVAAIVNGLGQGGLYGNQFIKAATAGTVSTIAIAVALVTFLQVPALIAGIVAGVGAFLFSALPNTNALSQTLSKDDVVPIPASVSTTRGLQKRLANAPSPGLSSEVGAASRLSSEVIVSPMREQRETEAGVASAPTLWQRLGRGFTAPAIEPAESFSPTVSFTGRQ